MLTEICQFLRNWFERDRLTGRFVVANGAITYADGTALSILEGQYYRIIGSVFNDGVHKLAEEDTLKNEPEFTGAVWLMAVPPAVAELDADIGKWLEDNAAALNSPYTSESFGGYSYSLRSATSGAAGEISGLSWQSQFAARLAPWRKV